MRKFVVLVVGCLAVVSGNDAVSAQEPADTAAAKLVPIHVRVLLGDDIAYTPGAASILLDQEIDRLRPHTLHDAFDFVAGVRTIDDDVLGRRAGIGIRGAPPRRSRKTLLLEDGSPINASTYLDPSAHYTPPLERLERVEILKGTGQLTHGPLNNHGVVNFRNKRPTATPETIIELAAGGQNTFKRHVMHTRTAGPVGLLFSYTGMNADGAFDVESHHFDDFFGSLDWNVSGNHHLTASLTYFQERSAGYDESNLTRQQFDVHPRSKSILEQGREFNNLFIELRRGQVAHDAHLGDRLRISSKLFATDLDRPRFQTDGTSPLEGGSMQGRDRLYRTVGAEVRVELAKVHTIGLEHTFQAGVRNEWHSLDDKRRIGRPGEILDKRNRGSTYAVAGTDGYTQDGRLIAYRAAARSAYLQNAMAVGNWVITPGVRVESFSQRKRADFWPGKTDEETAGTEHHTLLLPGLSLMYHGFEVAELYAGVHRGIAPAIARTEEFPLVPETGINTQVGFRSDAIRGLRFDAAVFLNRIENTLVRKEVDSFSDGLFINAADSRVYGFDVSLLANSSGYIRAPYVVFSQIVYNFTRAEFVTGPLNGNHVPEIPGHVGSWTLGLENLDDWAISATLSHFGAFFADKENTPEIQEDAGRVPGRTLVSARASYTWHGTPVVTFWVQGRNLADKLYISDVQDGLRPGAERTIIGGLKVRL